MIEVGSLGIFSVFYVLAGESGIYGLKKKIGRGMVDELRESLARIANVFCPWSLHLQKSARVLHAKVVFEVIVIMASIFWEE